LNLFLLTTVAAANFAVGVFAAGFFGYGPRRLRKIIQWIDSPPIRTPAFIEKLGTGVQSRVQGFRKSPELAEAEEE
jgi:hypothetical protein